MRDYTIYLEDRTTSGGGGVMIAVKSIYKCDHAPELDTNCELIWVKLQMPSKKNIHIGAYYRHHVSDESSVQEFDISLSRLAGSNDTTIIVGGDMNFPGWDWKSKQHSTQHYTELLKI